MSSTIDNDKQLGLENFFPSISKPINKPVKPKTVTTMLIKRSSPYSDTWICNNCTWTGDRWFMLKHPCRQNIKNNFARVKRQQDEEQSFKENRRILLK